MPEQTLKLIVLDSVVGGFILFVIIAITVCKIYDWYHWNKVLTEEEEREEITKRKEYKKFLLNSNPADLNDEQLKHREAFIQEDILESQKQLAIAQQTMAWMSLRSRSGSKT